MQAKGVAPEILRDKALSLQQLKRLAALDEGEEEEEELNIVKVTTMTATIKHSFPFAFFPKKESKIVT